MGYSPWGRKESDTTEQLSTHTRQRLRPGSFTAVELGSIPGQGTKISRAMQPKNKKYTNCTLKVCTLDVLYNITQLNM